MSGPTMSGPTISGVVRRLGVAAAVAGLLTGCASVPTSGPIQQGPVLDAGESVQFIRVIAAPPSAGADPEEIVRGFLEANASLEEDSAIARRYLTARAAAEWQPTASTTVYDETTLRLTSAGERVRAEYDVVGSLAPDGSLSTLAPAEPGRLTVHLERVVEGEATVPQWRITDPPDGIRISVSDLRRAYRRHDAHFMSRRSGVLVPDGRMLPVVGPSLPTTLAELVLDGPSQWLSPAVRGGPPEGTSLALGAVPVANGVADVELTAEVLAATDAQRRDLAAQLTWTLTQLPGISAVRLLVAGDPLIVPGSPAVMEQDTWRAQAPDSLSVGSSGQDVAPYYLLDETGLVRVSDVGRARIPIADAPPASSTTLAVSLDQRAAAVVEPDGAALRLIPLDRTTSAHRVPGERITSVSFEVDGRAWFVDDGRVRRVGPDGQAEDIPVTGAPSGISAIALARDGARVALIVAGSVHLGVLHRVGSGVVIGGLRRLESQIEQARDLAWRDAGSLDVLGTQQGSARQVVTIDIGSGQVLGQGAPTGPIDLASAPGAISLVVTRADEVFGNVGLQWREQDTGRAVAYPG
jgi:hypothetical protein